MNPAQFQNMGAMGVGMANPMQQQMRGNPQQQIQRTIMQDLTTHTQGLQAQGKFAPWHSTVTIEQRAGQVKLLIDSLRLIQPVVAIERAIDVALTFERKAFSQEPTRDKYLATIKEKLSRIQDTRASQVQSQSLQQMMQPGQQNMAFHPQLQQQMQSSPMMQQSMQHAQQNPNQGLLAQPGMAQPNMQPHMNFPNKSGFSEEDNKKINQLAAAMAKRTSPEDVVKIRESLTEQQKQQMATRNVDPLVFYFRAQATKEYGRRKFQMQMAQNGASQAQQMGQNFGPQMTNSPFAANINQLQGQQADGMRSQEVGELVVPVSNPQGMNPDQFQLRDGMVQNKQRQATSTPNPMLAQQQNQQNRQAQAQAQARAQAANRAGQLGMPGQNNPQSSPLPNGPPSQINRPGGQLPNRPSSIPVQHPQTGGPGQLGPQMQQQQAGQNPLNALSRFPPELQAILRQKPQTEWKATAQAYMAQQGRVAMDRSLSQQPSSMSMPPNGQIQQLPNGQYLGGSTMVQSLSSGAMPTQMPVPRSQPDNAQLMLQQQQQQRQMQQNQELARQRQISQIQRQQMQNQQHQAQLQQQLQVSQHQQQVTKPVGPPLNPSQMAYMDQQESHSTIGQGLQNHPQWSPAIKTWGQLKQWLQNNPVATLPISKIEEVQRVQFATIMGNRQRVLQQHTHFQQQQQLQQQQGTGLQMPQSGIQKQQLQQHMIAQGRPGIPPQMNTTMAHNAQVKAVTPEDIANARRLNPQFQSLPDARIAALMNTQRMKAVQNRMNEQATRQEPVFMPIQTGQPQAQQQGNPMARQPSSSGARPIPQQPAAPRPQSTIPPQNQSQNNAQVPPKNLKRPNEVENGQGQQIMQPGSRPQQQQGPGGVPNISKEQFDRLSPAQQQRYMAMKRMEQRTKDAQLAIAQLSKEVQASTPQRKGIANMSAANKARATKLLTQDQTKNMLGRFDQFIVQFLSLSNDREGTKQLLALRLQLLPQYKYPSTVNKTYEAADQFSMTADDIEAALAEMFQKFQMTLQKSAQMRQQAQGIQPQTQPTTQQLTPGNLERLQQEQQEAQRRNSKTSKGKDVPPAPTTSQSPFTFGDARGHGAPQYAATGIKQEDLKLDPKRRKRNPATGTISTTPVAPVGGGKAASTIKAEQQSKTMEPELPFKCSVANCEFQNKGFATQELLDRHATTAHRPAEEPVDDPLSFFIENMYKGLALDENGQPTQKPGLLPPAQPRSQPMQKTASTASIGVKQEVISKPGTPLPRPHSVRSAVGPALAATDADVWANAQVKPELLRDVFSGPDPFASDFNLEEFVDVYKQSDEWKNLPRADPKDGFCADWKAPADTLQSVVSSEEKSQEGTKLTTLASGDQKSPAGAVAAGGSSDVLVDLKIDGLDIEGEADDHDWEAIENMDLALDANLDGDFDFDMGSPWENVPSAEGSGSPVEQHVMTAEEVLAIPWEQFVEGGAELDEWEF